MYVLKNAAKNLGRNKGRNILLIVIIFALILSTTAALIINTTTTGIIDDYKNRFGSEVTLNVDFDKLMSGTKTDGSAPVEFPSPPEITPKQYLDFAKSKALKSYKMDSIVGITFDGLKAIDQDKKTEGMMSSSSIGGDGKEYVPPVACVLGFSDTKQLTDFSDGKRKITDGKIYSGKNECIISYDFATLNNLKVGDTINVVNSDKEENTISLKVSGIYSDATKPYGDVPEGAMSFASAFSNRRNEILVDFNTITENFAMGTFSINAKYELKSPEQLKEFEKELREKGLDASYIVATDEASYNKIVAPVLGLSKISMTFMWVILAVGGIILLLITSMAIRERKYEIGVLRAMGMKKIKVATMIVVEVLMITVVCLGAGLGIGSLVSQPLADSLIAGQIQSIEDSQNNQNMGGIVMGTPSHGGEQIEPLSKIDVSLTPNAALQISAVALSLALLSSIAGVIFITKYEPMKILSERN